jgi:N-acetyl-anhydromuramyl-L-alanine amidase AmpD
MIMLLQLKPYTCADEIVLQSPNFDVRASAGIEGVVLHATADEGNESGTLTWLRSRRSRVSCHLLISRSGQVTRLVGDQHRAWHAGRSFWRGTNDVNSITLGIEIANRNDGEPFTDAQYMRTAEIVAHYCQQGLSPDDVISHEAIAEQRRSDPRGWDWARFRSLVDELLQPTDAFDVLWTSYERRSSDRADGTHKGQLPAIAVPRQQVPAIAPPRQVPALPAPRQLPQITAPKQTIPAIPPPKPAPLTFKKPFLCSLWLNALTVLAAGSMIVSETLDLAFTIGFSVPEELTMWTLFGVGLVNIGLRYKTMCGLVNNGQGVPPLPEAASHMRGHRSGHDGTSGHDKGRAAKRSR